MLKLAQALAVAALALLAPLAVRAADLALPKENIYFSNAKPLSGEIVRIYATVKNASQQDVRASVKFAVNGNQVGGLQPITVLSQKESTVFVDWGPLEGYYDIEVSVVNPDIGDENQDNNAALVSDFVVDLDTDKDGIFDTIDMDDDNDTVEDGLERVKGSNPLIADTDKDGAPDGVDAFPADPNEKYDNDNDGIGNNADPDNDNDGVLNGDDPAPFDPNVTRKEVPQAPQAEPTPPVESEPAPAQESEPAVAPETEDYAIEAVEYTFPDEDEAEYSLDIVIAKSKVAWNGYQFEVLGGNSSYLYLWDFGDGTYEQTAQARHEFPGSGEYEVTLSASDGAGGLGVARERVSVGFWHMGNIMVQLMVGLLALFGAFLAGYLVYHAFVPERRK
ncbi:MAG: PKD domain-containing protein [Patescibacteria group bacterium]